MKTTTITVTEKQLMLLMRGLSHYMSNLTDEEGHFWIPEYEATYNEVQHMYMKDLNPLQMEFR